jgi:methionyl-tRNA synthetase
MAKFYVCTAIPYVNDKPHLGHAMLHLYADVLARYHRSLGDEVLYSAGTDEHGGKIAEKAAEAGVDPQQYADTLSQSFKELLEALNISNDRFIRTSDPDHTRRAQLIWQNLREYIYKGSYEGWYCTGDEEFFSEQVVKANNGICPDHNRPYEKVKEENYLFALSKFTQPVKEAIASDAYKIVPDSRKNEMISLLNSGLEDISISRPVNKISWGIPVPGDPSQVMYVWFEALMNYITVLGYPDGGDFKKFWPADVQVIGKNILRFHAAIWPAMLLGLKQPLPKQLYAHGFVEVDGKKMSKSLGNSIAPADIIAKYGADAFRYFFLRHIPSYGDGDFSWQRLDDVYNSELADQLGNAVSRTAAMIQQYENGVIGEMPHSEHDIRSYQDALEACRFDMALAEIWDQVKGLNQYIDEQKPWQLAKAASEKEHLSEVLAYMAGSLVEIADLLAPFMPDTAKKIKSVFESGLLQPLPAALFPKQTITKEA